MKHRCLKFMNLAAVSARCGRHKLEHSNFSWYAANLRVWSELWLDMWQLVGEGLYL